MRTFSLTRLWQMYEEAPDNVFWRHDVDVSLPAALQMARMEQALEVESTYYLMPTSPFYTVEEAGDAADELRAFGRRIGVHIDLRHMSLKSILDGSFRGVPVSFHCPNEYMLWADFGQFENAYAKRWKGWYVSDSRGRFAIQEPEELFLLAEGHEVQVNLHPEWWFVPRWFDGIEDDVYEDFFRESKRELVAA